MSYFHSNMVKSVGGLKGRLMKRLIGETWEEMVSLARDYPEKTTINSPPTGKLSYKSKSLPVLRIDADGDEILDEIGSDEVSRHHILVLTWLLRRDLYLRRHPMEDDVRLFFETGIRGSFRELLKAGVWIDEPETEGLKNLNSRLEKIDLGRRSDLKLSSQQDWDQLKNDMDRNRDDVPIIDVDDIYKNSSSSERQLLRSQKPWLASKWISEYGP